MKLRDTFRASFFCLVFAFTLLGCGEKKSSLLDQDDIRFAGFYSDYLLVSGVIASDETAVLAVHYSTELDSLLLRHAMTREILSRKVQLYKESPELWRSVLVQVRANIRKKTAGQ